ncbi:hypothetical protein ACSBR1_019130 [Camellia fascicularis]
MAETNDDGSGTPRVTITYMECRRNYAAHTAGLAVDGCLLYVKITDPTVQNQESYICATCGCHQSFHRKQEELNHFAAAAPLSSLPPPRPPRRSHRQPPQPVPIQPQPDPPKKDWMEMDDESKPLKKRKMDDKSKPLKKRKAIGTCNS